MGRPIAPDLVGTVYGPKRRSVVYGQHPGRTGNASIRQSGSGDSRRGKFEISLGEWKRCWKLYLDD
jgi:hypothetical protein